MRTALCYSQEAVSLAEYMKTILIVEDEPTLQKTIGQFLEQEGYTVQKALNGEIGLTMAKENKPDLILLDLILPKKDGFVILKELKEDKTTARIPIIILTNLEGSGDIEKALALGASTYLVKANYKLADIKAKIKETLK